MNGSEKQRKDRESLRSLEAIRSFVFVNDEVLEPADIIFIPGSSSTEVPEEAARLYQAGLAKWILPSGLGPARYEGKFIFNVRDQASYPGPYGSEWEFMRAVLLKEGVPDSVILREDEAVYTKQNAELSRQVLEAEGLSLQRAIICCKNYHARRSLLAYELEFPAVAFQVRGVPIEVNGQLITADTWSESRAGVRAVFGEVWRIGQQFEDDMLQGLDE